MFFYVLLTVHPGMILVIKQRNAQIFSSIWYAGAYAPAYQTVIYTDWHKPVVALIQ